MSALKQLDTIFAYICTCTPKWVKNKIDILDIWLYYFHKQYQQHTYYIYNDHNHHNNNNNNNTHNNRQLTWMNYLHGFNQINPKKLPISE